LILLDGALPGSWMPRAGMDPRSGPGCATSVPDVVGPAWAIAASRAAEEHFQVVH
jgi:hypothetical protein